MKSLKARVLLIFILFICVVGFLSLNEYLFSNKIKINQDLHNIVQEEQLRLLQMRRAEKDFFLRNDEKYIKKLITYSKEFDKQLVKLSENEEISFEIKEIAKETESYLETFLKISDLVFEIGIDENHGYKSLFRKRVHELESYLDKENSLKLSVVLLQLRRAEKDFFLRKDMKYVEKHTKIFNQLNSYKLSNETLSYFKYYKELFSIIVEKMQQIGLNEKENLRGKLRSSAHNIEYIFQKEHDITQALIDEKIASLLTAQYMIYLVLSILFIFISFIIIRPIFKSVDIFQDFFSSFDDSSKRLDTKKLYFYELQNISRTVNEMLCKREKIEKDLIHSRDEAIRLQEVKEQFLSNMSHELRTPLNAILGFSSIMQRNKIEDDKLITPIVDSSQHLLEIVNDILDISKIQSGKFEIHKEKFELIENLQSFFQRFEAGLERKNIHFIQDVDVKNKLYLEGDWLRISQILNNFLSNSIKFTPENGEIQFTLKYEAELLVVSVKDNGIGISKEAQSRILKPFEQADSSMTKEYGGTGLGLSIAESLSRTMGGKIEIESELSKGSTFTLTLPITQLFEEVEVLEDDEVLVSDNFSAHVLIAEDNKTNQLLLGMLLDDVGITFDIANDGVEAVAMYGKTDYDIVLMDENMPNLNGVEAMKEIRSKYSDVAPIIAVTANVMKGDEKRLFDAGMDDFIPKPIENEELIRTIAKYIK